MEREKVWELTKTGNIRHFGMSSALGATTADLPTGDDVPSGSDTIDFTTKDVYFFDGVSWK